MNTIVLPQFDDEKDSSAQAELLFGGDFCPIGKYGEKIMANENIFDERLSSLFKNIFSIINLEAPLCDPDIPADNSTHWQQNRGTYSVNHVFGVSTSLRPAVAGATIWHTTQPIGCRSPDPDVLH